MNVDAKLTCLVIDDDPLMTDLITHYCDKIPEIDTCISCNSAIDGLRLLSESSFDLVFLDYNMPDVNGKAILKLKQDNSKVIMITSHAEFAVESYGFDDIIDYLLKPVKFDRFQQAVEKAFNKSNVASTERESERFFVKDGKKWIPVRYDDILYIQSDSNYVIIHLDGQSIMTLLKLSDLENTLPEEFIRVHRSYIVNTNYVEYFTTEEISINKQIIPVSQAYKTKVKSIISS